MRLTGQLLIGQSAAFGQNGAFRAIDAATGAPLEPAFGGASPHDLETACALADDAFDAYRETSLDARAAFLDAIGRRIIALGDALIERCVAESGLPRARIEGERARTVGQLALFASVVRDGGFLDARIDPARPDRKPLPRVDLRLRNVAIGPVAVFGASNFPLAFSVAGGDTASALAAGCPVIVKAHSAHPGTSELVGRAIQAAVRECGLPAGVFSLLFDASREIGRALVADPRVKAVGFTGSRRGGVALMHIAAARHEPIPVYAEMSSINPVLLLPGALAARHDAIAQQFVASLTLGAGQFCTNPGLVLGIDGPALRAFERAAAAAVGAAAPATMLTPPIHASYCEGVARLASHDAVERLGEGAAGDRHQARAALFATTADAFVDRAALRDEVFGPASLIVRCPDADALHRVLKSLEGQLTIAAHLGDGDAPLFRTLLPTLERKAGRILVDGFGTGVEVGHAMVHGGPFPATSDTRTTSVGARAIERFLRPVSYQDLPAALLPDAIRDGNPLRVPQRIDGVIAPREPRDA
ncbi:MULTISPECIES: aldehyde dehydrogenase (NADP(+)) [pseudomallei group]|uniref:aldehyde dehydrogenase (NADP(+)) n=1 Tax=pseudomallei group TaxID=111527 RepID=UPI00016A7FBF|nr:MULTISPECIES: aldehyde dehydrogenase (NADP(+)) [pseudomallei group]AJX34873.1 aldehyde dehydrogenase family protein [Burkholderia oklahomensis C6786]AOI49733.1 2,5-dioxovalerate dehydrogenase [Burkholderia oklahomensis C6786]ARK46223.1 aldehyde dehydrogenase (NADP(+)) [Burkholderia pseudomallei]ARK56213.1 aldehyde dehydrogenase (NADP(+)) [Burkholderia pseudomallei]KUY51824.1 2,5-dioxovalerate dehydrogenase [Burkholderia oklahomensis C6786]